MAVPRHAQAPLDREGVADLFTHAVVFGGFLEIGVEQGHVSNSRSYEKVGMTEIKNKNETYQKTSDGYCLIGCLNQSQTATSN